MQVWQKVQELIETDNDMYNSFEVLFKDAYTFNKSSLLASPFAVVYGVDCFIDMYADIIKDRLRPDIISSHTIIRAIDEMCEDRWA